MRDFDPYLLRAFLAVADIGTVSGAAVALNRTQAAVSMQVKRLEDLASATLFERSTKGLKLTAKGEQLLPFAREITTLNEEIGRRLGAANVAGRVRLGVVEDFAATRLIDTLSAFRQANPDVEIDIIVEANRRLAAQLEAGELDAVVCDTSCLDRRPLHVWTEELVWTARTDLDLDPEAGLPVIMFEAQCPWNEKAIAALSRSGIRWKGACVASSLIAMVAAVRAGIGIVPMLPATIPAGCRILGNGSGIPSAIRIDIGLYVRPSASPETYSLADFVVGHARAEPA